MKNSKMSKGRMVRVMDQTDEKYNKVGTIIAISGAEVLVKFAFSKKQYRARQLKVVK